jgi:hypothetical protein
MTRIDLSPGRYDAAHHAASTGLYPEAEAVLRHALLRGAPFDTDWCSTKKGDHTFAIWLYPNNVLTVSVSGCLDEPDTLFDTLYWLATGSDDGPPEGAYEEHGDVLDGMTREYTVDRQVGVLDHFDSVDLAMSRIYRALDAAEDEVTTFLDGEVKGATLDLADSLGLPCPPALQQWAFDQGYNVEPPVDFSYFFGAERRNERHGGVSPSTLGSALDSYLQAPPDAQMDWAFGSEPDTFLVALRSTVETHGADTELDDLPDGPPFR